MTERIIVRDGRTPPAQVPFAPRVLAGVGAILRRDAGERRMLGMGFAFDFAFGIVNLAVFALISRTLHGSHSQLGGANSYFDFVAVGITFMLVVQAAGTQITSRVQEEQRSGTLEILVARPMSTLAVAIGVSAYPMLLAVTRAAAYLAVAGLLLGLDVGGADWLGLATMLALAGVTMMCLGIGLAAFAIAFEHGDTLGRLVIVAIGFGSGTYFPTAVLPTAVHWLSVPLPTRIALDGLRTALAGHRWGASALQLAAVATLSLFASVWLFGQSLRFAIRRGTLTRG
jgi:ABC-2 type transport system permease protein